MSEKAILDILRHLPASATVKSHASDTTCFAAQGRLPARALTVEVQGFGELGPALTADQAEALHRLSSPAHFGRRTETLLDPAVRDTGEISADALSLRWSAGMFADLQAEMARALGLESSGLALRLHNLLVYQVGQFFKPHQDTEKYPRMVGTAVLILPSAHIGGALRVWRGSEEQRFSSQQLAGAADIRWFAFYADCRHEVLPVEEGWRVALSFDLLLPKTAASTVPAPPALLTATRRFFDLDESPRLYPWALLLDHEYTEHGLRWELLKGSDRARVAALRAAGQELGLSVHLALAELHQSWTTHTDFESSRYGRDRYAEAQAEPDELIEESMVLDYWLGADDEVGRQTRLAISPAHTASFTETDDVHLVNSEHEGYMGNYGNTVDYWYRRAALVLQSPQAAERSRFVTDFESALGDLQKLAQRVSSDDKASFELSARVRANSDLLVRAVRDGGRALLGAYADIAAAVTDAQLAKDLVAGFRFANLLPKDATALARLAETRGMAWMQVVLEGWIATAESRLHWSGLTLKGADPTADGAPALWPVDLDKFMLACRRAGIAEALLDAMHAALLKLLVRADAALTQASPAQRRARWPVRLACVCQLARALRRASADAAHMAALLAHVGGLPTLYPPRDLTTLALASADPPLREVVIAALHAAMAEPLRGPDDHGMRGIDWVCRCQVCAPVLSWAEATGGQTLLLPLAEARRQHVAAKLQAAGVAITTELIKAGSPYRLRFSKPDDLRAQDQVLRDRWQADLERLKAV